MAVQTQLSRVAIIGGGYAGMAAAVTLVGHDCNVTVYESGKVLGGRARRVDYRDQALDNGQHILSGAYSELLRMMQRVGVGDDACVRLPLTMDMPPAFAIRAPRWPAPFHLLGAMLGAKGLTWADKLAAMRFIGLLRAQKFRVNDAETVAELLARHKQTKAVINYLWQPLTVSALNTPTHSASAQIFANVIRDALASRREASDMLLPQCDLSELFPEPAANWIQQRGGKVLPGIRVKSVERRDSQFYVEADHAPATFDAVVIAVGPHQLTALTLPAGTLPPIDFAYEPIVTVYLKFAAAVALSKPMIGQAAGTVQWFFDRRQLLASTDQDNGGMIAAVISASGPHQSLSQDELAAAVLRELATHTGDLPALVWHKVVVEKFATFACTPAAQRVRPDTQTQTPGIFLAGDYCAGDYPATLEGAVRNGIRAATAAVGYLAKGRST